MPTLSLAKNYADSDTLFSSDLDDIRVGIQDFLNTTKIDTDNIQTGGIATANLADSAVTTAKITASAVTKAKLDNAATSLTIVAKTSAYTLTTSDELVTVDTTSAFTLTLPAAASNSGRIYRILKTSSDANACTIDGNASETIGGSTTTTVNTQYECLTIVCDGSNWQVIERRCRTAWTDESSNFTFTGLGTVSNVNVWCRREGDSLYGRGSVTAGTPTSSTVTINFPAKFTFDNAKLASTANIQAMGILHRMKTGSTNTVDPGLTDVLFYDGSDTDALYVAQASNNYAFDKNGGTTVSASLDVFTFAFCVPVSGWWA